MIFLFTRLFAFNFLIEYFKNVFSLMYLLGHG